MINVVAIAKAKPGQAELVRAALEKLVTPTSAEPECQGYVLHVSADDPERFVTYEVWESREGLAAHMKTPHIKAFSSETGDALAGPLDLIVLDPLAGKL